MDHIIRELVAIDRQARQRVQDAQSKRAQEKAAITQEKEQLRERYLHRTQQKLDILEKRADEEAQRELAELEAHYQQVGRELADAFARQRGQWQEEIVARCLRP